MEGLLYVCCCWFVCWFLRLICVEFRLLASTTEERNPGGFQFEATSGPPVDLDSPGGTVFFLGEGHVLIYEVTGSTAAVAV